MNKTKRFTLSLASLLLISGIALTVPVSARDGTSGSDHPEDSQTAEGTSALPESSQTHHDSNDLTEQFREQAREKIEAKKLEVKEHTAAERQRSCTARKTSLTNRMANKVNQAKRHKQVFDNIYTKVKNFHDSKNLTVANYDALVADADLAQSNVQASIDALQSLDINLDCSSQTVASSVAGFQQAMKNTRDALKTYRAAIVDLIKGVRSALPQNDGSDSSANQTNQ